MVYRWIPWPRDAGSNPKPFLHFQGFFCNDNEIRYPYVPDTVPAQLLDWVFAIVAVITVRHKNPESVPDFDIPIPDSGSSSLPRSDPCPRSGSHSPNPIPFLKSRFLVVRCSKPDSFPDYAPAFAPLPISLVPPFPSPILFHPRFHPRFTRRLWSRS